VSIGILMTVARAFPLMLLLVLAVAPVFAEQQNTRTLQAESTATKADADVMSAFASQEIIVGQAVEISKKEKHSILFFMGVSLLIFLLVTAALGIAMGVYGKQVFIPHMIFAGFSVTLALAHSVVAIVWFYPF